MSKEITRLSVFNTDDIKTLERYAKHENPFVRAAVAGKRFLVKKGLTETQARYKRTQLANTYLKFNF